MKRIFCFCFAAMLLFSAGCGKQDADANADGFTVRADENVDQEYVDLLHTYFQAIDDRDYAAYRSTLYPAFEEQMHQYFEKQGISPEQNFADLCSTFDEDGYESWRLTEMYVSYYPEKNVDLDGYFDTYVSNGVFEEKFVEECRADAIEIRDLGFSLAALYEGDEEPVTVIDGNEIIAIKTASGVYLFG